MINYWIVIVYHQSGKSKDSKQRNAADLQRVNKRQCFILILNCFEKVIGCSELFANDTIALMTDILLPFTKMKGGKASKAAKDHGIHDKRNLLRDAFDYFEPFSDSVVDFDACIALVNLLTAIVTKAESDVKLANRVSDLARSFLQRTWKQDKLKVSEYD